MTAPHVAVNLWDWDPAWNDLGLFSTFCDQLMDLGVDAIETTAPWSETEPEAGRVDADPVLERLAIARDRGLEVRLRLNFQDPPRWLTPPWSSDGTGRPFEKGYGRQPLFPSLVDPGLTDRWVSWSEAIAAALGPLAPTYSLGMGLHFELKYGEWLGYERFTTAPPPARCEGQPLSPAVISWIAQRETLLRNLVDSLAAAVRRGSPDARISAPLGEGFRHQSARFGNQDIAGLAAHADDVVYSHDFFIHGPGSEWQLETSTAIYRTATDRPVHVELDGSGTGVYQRFGDEGLLEQARAALRGGATGFNVANFTGRREWSDDLAQFAFLPRLKDLELPGPDVEPDLAVLLSSWSYYVDRDESESLHAAHYGLVDALRRGGHAVRAIGSAAAITRLAPGSTLVLPARSVVDAALLSAIESRPDVHLIGSAAEDPRQLDSEWRLSPWRPALSGVLRGDYTRHNGGPIPSSIGAGEWEGRA
ncbi:hypothetical protein [Schumannella luteola]